MPVRSLTSSVFRWPGHDEVIQAAEAWAKELAEEQTEVVAVGCFGSYARGDYGVGSDLDLVVLLSKSTLPPERRNLSWPLEKLPVPSEVLVYTLSEWAQLERSNTRFYRQLEDEIVWLWCKKKLLPNLVNGKLSPASHPWIHRPPRVVGDCS